MPEGSENMRQILSLTESFWWTILATQLSPFKYLLCHCDPSGIWSNFLNLLSAKGAFQIKPPQVSS